MNILITGVSGFIGKTLLKQIVSKKIFANDRLILLTGKDIPGFECIGHKDYTFTKDDFICAGVSQIDTVIHLGSAVPQTRGDYLIENGYKFTANVRNTIHLYENLPSAPAKFIYISSVDVYEGIYNNDGAVISEQTPLFPATLYAASKIMCEKYLEEKSKTDNFVLQILRLGPIYGIGEETYSKIVSSFVRQIENDLPVKIFGAGEELRSQLLVDDCCRCILQAVSFNEPKGPVNLVSSQSASVKDLFLMICRASGKCPPAPSDITAAKSFPVRSNRFDNTKMKQLFSITETPLQTGVQMYVDYYRKETHERI